MWTESDTKHLADGTTAQLDKRAAVLDREANFFTTEAKRIQLVSAEVKAPTRLDGLELGRITAGGGSRARMCGEVGGLEVLKGAIQHKNQADDSKHS